MCCGLTVEKVFQLMPEGAKSQKSLMSRDHLFQAAKATRWTKNQQCNNKAEMAVDYFGSESVEARRLHSWPIDALEFKDKSIGFSNR